AVGEAVRQVRAEHVPRRAVRRFERGREWQARAPRIDGDWKEDLGGGAPHEAQIGGEDLAVTIGDRADVIEPARVAARAPADVADERLHDEAVVALLELHEGIELFATRDRVDA